MTDSVFDVALEKRFTDSEEIATINVTSADTLLIRDSATGVIMRLSFATLASAISSAFSASFASLIDGKVPASQLPSFVDDVLEYASIAGFPATGETSKIYIALDSNKTYRWSGSSYVEISASPGSTDAVSEGATNLYFTNARASAAAPVQSVAGRTGTVTLSKSDVGLSNVDNTSDANKPVSTAQQLALDAKATQTTGTFTPIAFGTSSAGTATYAYQHGQYTKIGRLVFFDLIIGWSSHTGTGNLRIGGLPLAKSNIANNYANLIIGDVYNLSLASASYYPVAYIGGSDDYITIKQVPNGGGVSANVSMDANVNYLQISGFYIGA